MPYVELCIILDSAFLTWAAQLQGTLAQKGCFNKLTGSRDPGTHQWRRKCTGRSTKNLRKHSQHGKPTKNIRKTYEKHTKRLRKTRLQSIRDLSTLDGKSRIGSFFVCFLYVFCSFLGKATTCWGHAPPINMAHNSKWDVLESPKIVICVKPDMAQCLPNLTWYEFFRFPWPRLWPPPPTRPGALCGKPLAPSPRPWAQETHYPMDWPIAWV